MNDDVPSDLAPHALVQEADCAERVVVLKIRVPGRTSYVIVASPRSGKPGAALLAGDGRRLAWGARLPPGMSRQRAREEALSRAEVIALSDREACILQSGIPRVVRAEASRVIVTDGGVPDHALPFLTLSDTERTNLEARGAELARLLGETAVEERLAEGLRVLDKALQRIDRRREAIQGDLAKIEEAYRIASQAQWLIAEASRATRGSTKLTVTDWSTGEPVELTVPLDPAKSPKDQVMAMFKRAKRLRLGGRVARARLEQAEEQRNTIVEAKVLLASARELSDIDAVLDRAKRAAPRDVTRASPALATGRAATMSKEKGGRTPFRAFSSEHGRTLLVGKGAADNDALTLHIAKPHDLWLHAKDRVGAHVIVPLDKGHTCPSEDLIDAAHLAAHFSEARDELVVDVQYVERRHIRKPKGSPPGLVLPSREKVLALRVDPERLRRLLEREQL